MREAWRISLTLRRYLVSNLGRVKLATPGAKPRATRLDHDGYERLNAWLDGRLQTFLVHRLVYEAFHGIRDPKLAIDHIDGNKRNNRPKNLRQLSPGENVGREFRLGRMKVCHPVVLGGVKYYSKREAERRTGIPRATL